MTRVYPDKNPFPYQGTMTVEATADTESDDSYQIPRTLKLDPVTKLLKHFQSYLNRFSSTEDPQGQFVALRGDHGSGKTHAIKYVMDRVKEQGQSGITKPTQLYAQAKKPDFLLIYRQLINQISIDELKDLNIRFLGVVASEQLGKISKDKDAKDEIAAKLRDDPSKLFELFRNYLVEEGAVQERQKTEVKKLSPTGGDDFRRAFSYILNPELSRSSYNWLTGQAITDEEARRLGVTGAITSSEAGVLALQLFAALFNRIGRPLIIIIDQYEKLVLAEDKVLTAANIGLLHSLLELIPKANGMFVVAGNEEAWEALPRDLVSRFAGNVIDFPVLKPDEALEMIRLYLTPITEDFTSDNSTTRNSQDGDAFYPFEEDAAKSIVTYCGGNIRRLLQICSKSFEAAAPQQKPITTKLVDRVLEEGNLTYYSREQVRYEIERILSADNLTFARESRLGDFVADLAVIDDKGKPLMLFKINEAAFHEQEAQQALKALRQVQAIRQQGIQAPAVFIALGYVSDEVTRTIREFAQDFLVYKPQTFATDLSLVLSRLERAATAAPDSPKYVESLEEKIRDLSTKLEDLLNERKTESNVVESRLAEFFERQSKDRLEEKRLSARPAWAEERRRIEKEIQEARQRREENELRELERLRDRAEKDRQRKAGLQALMISLLCLGWFFYPVIRALNRGGSIEPAIAYALGNPMFSFLLVIAIVMSVLLILRARNVLGPTLYREIAATVNSKRELERLAHQYVVQRHSIINSLLSTMPRPWWLLLQDQNPQYRYVGVIAAERKWENQPFLDMLRSERSTIVRRAIAQRLKVKGLDSARLSELSSEFVPEMAYVIEAAGRNGESLDLPPLPKSLEVLAAYYGIPPHYGTLAVELAMSEPYSGRRDYSPLGELFRSGFDRVGFNFPPIAETDVRSALRELSPFDEGGLGTFDELKAINQIDQFYIFFRQVLFYMEHDLLAG